MSSSIGGGLRRAPLTAAMDKPGETAGEEESSAVSVGRSAKETTTRDSPASSRMITRGTSSGGHSVRVLSNQAAAAILFRRLASTHRPRIVWTSGAADASPAWSGADLMASMPRVWRILVATSRSYSAPLRRSYPLMPLPLCVVSSRRVRASATASTLRPSEAGP